MYTWAWMKEPEQNLARLEEREGGGLLKIRGRDWIIERIHWMNRDTGKYQGLWSPLRDYFIIEWRVSCSLSFFKFVMLLPFDQQVKIFFFLLHLCAVRKEIKVSSLSQTESGRTGTHYSGAGLHSGWMGKKMNKYNNYKNPGGNMNREGSLQEKWCLGLLKKFFVVFCSGE